MKGVDAVGEKMSGASPPNRAGKSLAAQVVIAVCIKLTVINSSIIFGHTDPTNYPVQRGFDWVAHDGDASESRMDVGLHRGGHGARRFVEVADHLG